MKFVMKHCTTPENAQVARAIVDANLQAISNCIKKGTFSLKRYDEILKDQELQGEYAQMFEALCIGEAEAFNLLYNDIKDKPDTFCGWLDFYNNCLEASTGLELLHRTRLFYQIEDFEEEN